MGSGDPRGLPRAEVTLRRGGRRGALPGWWRREPAGAKPGAAGCGWRMFRAVNGDGAAQGSLSGTGGLCGCRRGKPPPAALGSRSVSSPAGSSVTGTGAQGRRAAPSRSAVAPGQPGAGSGGAARRPRRAQRSPPPRHSSPPGTAVPGERRRRAPQHRARGEPEQPRGWALGAKFEKVTLFLEILNLRALEGGLCRPVLLLRPGCVRR